MVTFSKVILHQILIIWILDLTGFINYTKATCPDNKRSQQLKDT